MSIAVGCDVGARPNPPPGTVGTKDTEGAGEAEGASVGCGEGTGVGKVLMVGSEVGSAVGAGVYWKSTNQPGLNASLVSP